jgi:hypothetical protein
MRELVHVQGGQCGNQIGKATFNDMLLIIHLDEVAVALAVDTGG